MTRQTTVLKVAALFAILLTTTKAIPYSFQTHEELIDLTWKQSIRPILLKRFPTLTEPQLREAHAYAYGGCAIQDIGYYPFGNPFYSDLMHYVRTGDFIRTLLRDAHTADELAFAIGALSHYVGDNIGHSEAINPSVAIEFPKLEKKYGPSVNYAEGKHPHIRTEFAFDINEIGKRRFAPSAYLKHVGLFVATDLLRRAFFETYGIDLAGLLGKKERVLHGYSFAIRSFLPRIAYAEAVLHRHRFPADAPGAPVDQLKRELAQSELENGWDAYREKAGIGTYSLAGLIFILPKIGFLNNLAIRGPIPRTQEMYVESLNRTTDSMRQLLKNFDKISRSLPNRDLDTGFKVKPGGYRLTDDTYADLVIKLTSTPTHPIPIGLQRDINEYYSDPNAPIITKKDPARWAQVQAQLKVLQTMPTTTDPDDVLDSNDNAAPNPADE